MKSHINTATIFIFFGFLAVLFTYPSVRYLNTKLIGDDGDNTMYYSFTQQIKNNILNGFSPFSYSYQYYFPVGFDLYTGSDAKLFVLLVGYLSTIYNEIFVYNTTILFVLTLNAVCSYILFRTISHSALVSIIGTIIWAFSYYTVSRAGSYAVIMQMYGYALFFASILLIYRKNAVSWSNVFFTIISLLLLCLSTLQGILILMASIFIMLPFVAVFNFPVIRNSYQIIISNWQKIVIGFLVFSALFVLFFYKHIMAYNILSKSSITYQNSYDSAPAYSDLLTYVIPTDYSKSILSGFIYQLIPSLRTELFHARGIDSVRFLGYVEIILLIYFFRFIPQAWKKILSVALVFFIIYGVSHNRTTGIFLLFSLLYKYTVLSFVHEPGRFQIITDFIIALAVVLGMTVKKVGNTVLLTAIALLILERTTVNFHTYTLESKNYHTVVSQTNTKAVLDLPLSYDNPVFPPMYNLNPQYYGKPIVNGYVVWLAYSDNPRRFIEENNELIQFGCSEKANTIHDNSVFNTLLYRLKQNNITTVVIHDDWMENPACGIARGKIEEFILLNSLENKKGNNFLQIYDKDNVRIFTIN